MSIHSILLLIPICSQDIYPVRFNSILHLSTTNSRKVQQYSAEKDAEINNWVDQSENALIKRFSANLKDFNLKLCMHYYRV